MHKARRPCNMVEHTAATTSGFGQQSPKESNDDDVVYIGTFKGHLLADPHDSKKNGKKSATPSRPSSIDEAGPWTGTSSKNRYSVCAKDGR
ncbi:hypothetical protein Landi51_13501 [Colletotrichum acutatum]